ncbi:hypothetical protein PV387_36040 [Streptomyces sp. ME02-6987-2C]|uniref:hypothetical protein n=1 Tax=unclassified Streptomyces TaxID=2593676 RepID=UPI0029AAE374|nr:MULTISPECIES: hypothetical protein [unclassified Streptomyces]MDX3371351.1 hypothetical protein [Streptomyces sp. ME02-6987-2C]MDX3426357.1 hypothetical protein [Streptomyces sp. ME02-6985-2c]
MVSQKLGATPRRLVQACASGSPHDALAQWVATLAHRLDDLHQQLVTQALHCADTLTRVATGKGQINSLGILQNSGMQIDILAARRADAIEHLTLAIHVYQQLDEPQIRHTAASPVAKLKTHPTRGR